MLIHTAAKSKPPFFISSCIERRPPAVAVRSFSPSRRWQQTSEGAVQPSGERSRCCAASARQAGWRRRRLLSSPAFAAAAASLCGSGRERGFDYRLGQGAVRGGGSTRGREGIRSADNFGRARREVFLKKKLVPNVTPTLSSTTTAAICAVPMTSCLSEALNKGALRGGERKNPHARRKTLNSLKFVNHA